VLVIGVGNRYRADDGAGPAVAAGIAALGIPGVQAAEHCGEGAGLMALWERARRVVLVDAARSGSPPGTIHRFNARAQRVPSGLFNYSTHAFSLAEAVEMARVLGTLPAEVIVYGIEAENFGRGEGLSAQVRESVERVIERIVDELRQQIGSSHHA
jgi:hydrogenase maturation protease